MTSPEPLVPLLLRCKKGNLLFFCACSQVDLEPNS